MRPVGPPITHDQPRTQFPARTGQRRHAARRLRGGAPGPTASNRVYDREFGFELGANDYITKPFSFDTLMDIIRMRLAG